MKRKSKFANCSCRESDINNKFMHGNLGDNEKEQFKKDDKNRRKEMYDNLDYVKKKDK